MVIAGEVSKHYQNEQEAGDDVYDVIAFVATSRSSVSERKSVGKCGLKSSLMLCTPTEKENCAYMHVAALALETIGR